MSIISEAAVKTLESKLPGVTILTPSSEGYEESLKRWSTYGEKRAVSF